MSVLFKPIKLGSIEIKNRIIMAPLTRARAGRERVPNELMLKYYTQRASAGLILTEATAIDPMGVGYADTPGIWNEEQVQGWKKIVEGVHAQGSKIVLQLWHVGRISHPMFLNGQLPVAPSAIQPKGHVSLVRPQVNYPVPRALETSEIKDIVAQYKRAAENAKRAGFDGVEIHGANGYLIDQFLQDKTNQRTDMYGGSIENRARFALEVTDAVVSVWGADKVGYHISPRGDSNDMGGNDLDGTFTYLATELGKRKLAFLFAREYQSENSLGPKLKKAFGGVYIANEKLTKETAEQIILKGDADAVAFGVPFISNPDLPLRLEKNLKLNETNFQTIYAPGETGYTDYPSV